MEPGLELVVVMVGVAGLLGLLGLLVTEGLAGEEAEGRMG